MSMITCLCLVLLSILLLLPSQASSARHLGIVLHNKDPPAEEKRLLLNLSYKNDDGTKWVKAKNYVLPLKESATSIREQQKDSITLDVKSHQDQEIKVEGNYNKDQDQDATKVGPFHEPHNNKVNIPRDHQSKMVESKVHLSGAPNPVSMVSWRLPQQKRKRRKKKKKTRGSSHDPEFTLDYAPPRVHPPCHN